MMPAQTAEQRKLERELSNGLNALDQNFAPGTNEKLLRYVSLISKWNRVHNLTAIRDPARMISHHILDSLAIIPFIKGPRLLDVGTGAGLPGIPVAIACPGLAVTLIDSNSKKFAFLQQVTTELVLGNVQSVCARVERWAGGPFETIVSRAYSELKQFVSSAQHLLSEGGVLAAMKGALPASEIDELPPGFRVRGIERLAVQGLDAERHLILIEKS